MTGVFTHILGTLAVIAVTLAVITVFQGVADYYCLEATRVQLREVVEAVGRGVVEAVSLHTIGGGSVTVMELKMPLRISGMSYTVRIRGESSGVVELVGTLSNLNYTRTIVLPNFGEGVVEAVEGPVTLECSGVELEVSDNVRMPLSGRVYVVILREGEKSLLGFMQGDLTVEEIDAISSGACSWGG